MLACEVLLGRTGYGNLVRHDATKERRYTQGIVIRAGVELSIWQNQQLFIDEMTNNTSQPLNAMTVDVEDYFQVSAFDPYVERSTWGNYAGRVEASTDRILELFNKYDVRGTFFTLGWVAEKYPALVRRIVDGGHELASHGWDHIMVTRFSRDEFGADIKKAKSILEDTTGAEVLGYRAPSYSFTTKNDWAHAVLAEQGYTYSSSVAPIKHDLYGIPDAPRFAHRRANGAVVELPITTTRVLGRNMPCGGGGWFRLYPYQLSHWAINRVHKKDSERAIFYFHPWEIDPDQPRIDGLNLRTRFRHYQNLSRMEPRIEQLLGDFRWGTMTDVFAPELA